MTSTLSARKGFKFTKRGTVVQADTLSFEDIENETKSPDISTSVKRKLDSVSLFKKYSPEKKIKTGSPSPDISKTASKNRSAVELVIPSMSKDTRNTSIASSAYVKTPLSVESTHKRDSIATKSSEKEVQSSSSKFNGDLKINKSNTPINKLAAKPSPLNSAELSRENKSKILEKIIPKASESSKDINQTKNAASKQTVAESSSGKAYYPRIQYKLPSNLNSSSDHSKLFLNLVADICKVEAAGLSHYFKSSTNASRKKLETDLLEVLDTLQTELKANISQSIQFQAETTSTEKALREKMVTRINDLEQYLEKIEEYNSGNDVLGQDFNIWLTNIPEKSALKMDNVISDSTAEVVSRYCKLLEDIEKHCDAILKEIESVDKVVSHSKKSQEVLYKTYTEMGSEEPDTKSVVKQYRQYL